MKILGSGRAMDRRWQVGLGLLLLGLLAYWLFRPNDTLNVPLGVEQAAIITYGGPSLAVKPYKWGVAVNVRMAQVSGQASARIYDVRYLVNREGTFDLKDFLIAEDGRPLDGLPSFKFNGDPKLSKQLENRIRETENIGVEISGHYYAKLLGLIVLWLGWLLLIIFYGRPKPLPLAVASLVPTLAEQLRELMARLEDGSLDAEGKAKLELLMLRCWREGLVPAEATMAEGWAAVSRDVNTAEALFRLELWLHRPASGVSRAEITALVAPFTISKIAVPSEPSAS